MIKRTFVTLICGLLTTDVFAETHKLAGIYTYPIEDPALQDLASYELVSYEVEELDGKRDFIRYALPRELVGDDAKLISMGRIREEEKVPNKDTKKYFASSQGSAVCEGKWMNLKCEVRFKKNQFDWQSTEKFIQEKYSETPEVMSFKLAIAAAFQTEPIGTIEITGHKH